MDVEDPSGKRPEQGFLDHAHKSRKDDKIGFRLLQKAHHLLLRLRGHLCPERTWGNAMRRKGKLTGQGKNPRIGHIREDDHG